MLTLSVYSVPDIFCCIWKLERSTLQLEYIGWTVPRHKRCIIVDKLDAQFL